MKKVYDKGAISMIACKHGFLFTAMQNELEDDGKTIISFKQHDLETSTTSLVTKNAYLLHKFGAHFEFFTQTLEDYYNCKTCVLEDRKVFIVHPAGQAWIYDVRCNLKWEGDIRYKGFGPADIAVDNKYIWCSYPENNAIIKYNFNTMRQEFKVGGSASGGIKEPCGLWLDNNNLIVTSYANGDVFSLDLDVFHMEKLLEHEEPIIQYFKIDFKDVVLTKSGIYIL